MFCRILEIDMCNYMDYMGIVLVLNLLSVLITCGIS